MIKPTTFLTLFYVFGLSTFAIAQDPIATMQWDRNSAIAAARSVDIDATVYQLSDHSALADGQATLTRLNELENRSDWPMPAREAAIHQFTRSLADLPRDTVSPMVMGYLKNYQVHTMVQGEDHSNAYIPLFNIRGAAAGVENSWQRQEFVFEGESLVQSDPESLVEAYISATSNNQRLAYVDVVKNAPLSDVIAVQHKALEHLAGTPSLTALVAVTATITMDHQAIQLLLTGGQGVGISTALQDIAENLSRSEISELLIFAIEYAPAVNASIAMAVWSPLVRHQPEIRDLMIDMLASPELGASATLALAHQPDIQTIKILQDTADGDSAAAQRAQMALDLNRNQLIGETQP